MLGTGRSNKNDPNDARSIAIAALRSTSLTAVRPADHATGLKMQARRNKQLAASRTRVCRLHAVIRELVESGTGPKLKAGKAKLLLKPFEPASPVQVVRHQMALEHLDDLAHVDAQIAELHSRIRGAVAAANTSVTEIHGVGAIVAAMVIGYSGDITRFRDRNHYAAYTPGLRPSSCHPVTG